MRPITCFSALAFALMLAACASRAPKPKEPLQLDLTIRAATNVNLNDQGRATPIVVRIYELKTDGAFNAADFYSLQDKDKTELADDLVKRDQFRLRPGEQARVTRTADPASTTLGITAAYRDLPHAVWRTVHPMPAAPDKAWYRLASPRLKLTITLDANAINVTETSK
ncbi:MAG: type secretion system protein VasD [Paraburkholderia sp.]|nr:type secretion system protein VasD [Paraburkholderia sp.]